MCFPGRGLPIRFALFFLESYLGNISGQRHSAEPSPCILLLLLSFPNFWALLCWGPSFLRDEMGNLQAPVKTLSSLPSCSLKNCVTNLCPVKLVQIKRIPWVGFFFFSIPSFGNLFLFKKFKFSKISWLDTSDLHILGRKSPGNTRKSCFAGFNKWEKLQRTFLNCWKSSSNLLNPREHQISPPLWGLRWLVDQLSPSYLWRDSTPCPDPPGWLDSPSWRWGSSCCKVSR